MKKIIAFLITAILLFTLVTVPASAAGSGTLAMSSASAKQGDSVTLNVNMSKNPGLVTLAISVEYDTSVFQLTKVTDAGLVVGSQLNNSYSSPYKITWVDGAATKNNTKTGKIASFTFKVKDGAKVGATNVTLKFSESYDSNYGENTFSASSGKITVTCKNHSFGAYTKVNDTQHSRTCSACKYVEKTSHSWNSGTVTKKATCKEAGSKKVTCTKCNHSATQTIAKTNDHKFSEWKKVKDPDCTNKGKEERTCSVCNKKETRDIKAAGHKFSDPVVTKQPTCTEKGKETGTCSVCNAKTEQDIATLPHNYGEAVVTKEPTETEKGIKTKTCKDCGHKTEEEIPVKDKTEEPKQEETESAPADTAPEKEETAPTEPKSEDKPADATLPWILFAVAAVVALGEAVALVILASKKKSV